MTIQDMVNTSASEVWKSPFQPWKTGRNTNRSMWLWAQKPQTIWLPKYFTMGTGKKTCFGPHLPSWQRWWVQPTGASFPRNVAISSSPGPSTRDATDATVAFGFQSCKSIAHGEAAHAAHAAHAVRLQREWRASWRLEQWKKVKNSELRDYHGQLRDYPEYLPWNTKN